MGRQPLAGPFTEYIAGELRAQRSRRQWTLDDIAERTGINRMTVNRYLSGKSAIAVEVLIPLCEGMEMDVGKLIDGAMNSAD